MKIWIVTGKNPYLKNFVFAFSSKEKAEYQRDVLKYFMWESALVCVELDSNVHVEF